MPIALRRPAIALAGLFLMATNAIAQPAAAPVAPATTTRVERGEIGGAVWRAEIPADWNGELILYLHGYHAGDRPFPSDGRTQTSFRNVFVGRGYAYAQSHYAKDGWAVKEALADTEALRRHILAELGKKGPVKRTWLLGHSMGGFLTALLLERDPDLYAGGVAFCPPLAPATDFFEHGLFDLLAAFDLLAGKAQGLPPLADPNSPAVEPEKLGAALQAAPPAAVAALGAQFQIKPADLPLVLDFYQRIWKELIARAGGMPIDNRDTLYAGFGDDPAFNRGIRRVEADPAARTYLQQYGTPTGKWADPLLVVHTTYDAIVPPRWPAGFANTVERAGTSHLYRLQWVARDGHCPFTPDESWQAFSNLLRWVDGGQAPASGELLLQ